MEEYKFGENVDKNKLTNLTSEYYIFREKDKEYLSRYYNSLVKDLIHVTLDTKEVVDATYATLQKGNELNFDFASFIEGKNDYAAKTIAHMVTLIMFAAHHCTLVTNIDGDEAQKDIIHDITDLFINQLDEELWEELYDNLLIDLDKVVQICSLSYHKNLENALKSIQMDFPDFLSEA